LLGSEYHLFDIFIGQVLSSASRGCNATILVHIFTFFSTKIYGQSTEYFNDGGSCGCILSVFNCCQSRK